MRLALIFILTFASLSHAADDAPIMFEVAPGYVCVPETQRVNEGKAYARCQATNEALTKGNVVVPVPAFVAITVGGVALGAIVTGLVIGFAKK